MCKIHITLEGNIGVGKSTMLSNIHRHFGTDRGISYCWEPLKEWDENNFLKDMYSKNISHAEFQYMVACSMFKQTFDGLLNSNILIQERSMDTSFEVFTNSNVKNSKSRELLKYSYQKLRNVLEDTFSMKVFRIYLRVSPQVSFSRISQRNRSSESLITEDYVQTIHDFYEKWLYIEDNEFIISIDASRDIKEVTNDVIDAIYSIIQ